jgi:hypothetical protein
MVATVAIAASLLLIAAILIRDTRLTVTPMRRDRMIGLGLAALLVAGALAFVLGILMGAGMECFD